MSHMPMSIDEGRTAVRLAREAVEAHVDGTNDAHSASNSRPFPDLRGVFVTINLAEPSEHRLRGCVGFPFPIKKLGDAIWEAAVAAASEDPRFPPVTSDELGSIVFEVSILTQPRDLEGSRLELPSRVTLGEDGLMVSYSSFSGLLLPQVATEFGMDQEEFLSQACVKAGLLPDAWLDSKTRVQTFQAEVFAESSPRGGVVRLSTGGSQG